MSTRSHLGQPCAKCGGDDTETLWTHRHWKGFLLTKRRHLCHRCGHRWNSMQQNEGSWRGLVDKTRPATRTRVD